MNKSICKCLLLVGLLVFSTVITISAQQRVLIHSHNDYDRTVPFYQAYAQQVASIEADIYKGTASDELLVAHDRENLPTAPTIDEAYLQPLVNLFKQNGGKPWRNSNNTLSLLVDLKDPASLVLNTLVKKLQAHPHVFDPAVNPYAVRVIISGKVPDPDDFGKYPDIISFDGSRLDYTPEQLKRISMISLELAKYTDWNGKGTLKIDQEKAIREKIAGVHALGKPIRFWATPDGVTAWNTLHNFGVDYINTDVPELCADYFRNFENKNYHIAGHNDELGDGVSRAKRLDKTTSGFQGFDNKKLQLSKGIDIYQPTYRNDGANTKIKNVIFLIGDGTGLAQICAGETVNNGLTMILMKYLGLQKTSSRDAYTTDSAAAGSALATGQKHNNRHISMSPEGVPYPSMTDVLFPEGYACGVITLGNLADATPAAFYGHATERDDSDNITKWLTDGKLTVLNGSGMEVFTKRQDSKDLLGELKTKGYRISESVDDIDDTNEKIICIDARMDLAASEETLSLLADATSRTIKKLSKASKKGFFLMVEGAKIDYAGHANSLPGSVMETLSFDLAIAEALKFADSNGETLVIVTGDHETGGLTLVDGDRETGHLTARYMTDDHTPIMLPVFAYGPGASKFIGVYENTHIFQAIKLLMGVK